MYKILSRYSETNSVIWLFGPKFQITCAEIIDFYPHESEGLWNHRRWFVCLFVCLLVCYHNN